MQTITAIYDGVGFKPTQPIPVEGQYEVLITFVAPKSPKSENALVSDKLPRTTAKGILKDKVWMSDDFNEPLEELGDYM